MSTILEADTLLAVDVGTVNTRASLFDVVDGRYRMVATGRGSSTAGAPLFDVREGMHAALDEVSEITGRAFFDESEALVMPTTAAGAGVDAFVSTASAGPHLRTVLVGLMPGVSLESARRLASATYLNVVDEIGLMDSRREEAQIDVILAAKPDLVLMVGGTDGGATASVIRQIETVSLATNLLPTVQRPALIFAGNTSLGAAVMERFQDRSAVAVVSNIRPDLEHEELGPARLRLAELINQLRSHRIAGFEDLHAWSGGYSMLTADAFSRVVRYLSQVYDPDKGVLGIDVGAAHGFEHKSTFRVRDRSEVEIIRLGIFTSGVRVIEGPPSIPDEEPAEPEAAPAPAPVQGKIQSWKELEQLGCPGWIHNER